jgi:hypothetical protein
MFDENSSSTMLRHIDRSIRRNFSSCLPVDTAWLPRTLECLSTRHDNPTFRMLCVTVSALLETRWQQASRHVTEAETLQKQNNPGLQNTGRGCHQHGSGRLLLNTIPTVVYKIVMSVVLRIPYFFSNGIKSTQIGSFIVRVDCCIPTLLGGFWHCESLVHVLGRIWLEYLVSYVTWH